MIYTIAAVCVGRILLQIDNSLIIYHLLVDQQVAERHRGSGKCGARDEEEDRYGEKQYSSWCQMSCHVMSCLRTS